MIFNICLFSIFPFLDIFWFRIESEVHELEEDEKYEMTKDTNKHTLTIHYPSKTEAGQYMCIAVNEKGKCSEYFILNIEGKYNHTLRLYISMRYKKVD